MREGIIVNLGRELLEESKAREYTAALQKTLEEDGGVREVTVRADRMADVSPLVPVVAAGKNLQRLYLGSCNLTDQDAITLSSALKESKTLRILRLAINRVTAVGAKALLDALHHNNTLELLDLSHNPIEMAESPELLASLTEVLRSNATLKVIYLFGAGLAPKERLAIMKALQVNSTLQELRIDGENLVKARK